MDFLSACPNTAGGPNASVIGGASNAAASGQSASVSGGFSNTADGFLKISKPQDFGKNFDQIEMARSGIIIRSGN
jgi:hypothetical protein